MREFVLAGRLAPGELLNDQLVLEVLQLLSRVIDPARQFRKFLGDAFELFSRFFIQSGLQVEPGDCEAVVGILRIADVSDHCVELGRRHRLRGDAVVPLVVDARYRNDLGRDFRGAHDDLVRSFFRLDGVSSPPELVERRGGNKPPHRLLHAVFVLHDGKGFVL